MVSFEYRRVVERHDLLDTKRAMVVGCVVAKLSHETNRLCSVAIVVVLYNIVPSLYSLNPFNVLMLFPIGLLLG